MNAESRTRRPIYRIPFEAAFLLLGIYLIIRLIPALLNELASMSPYLQLLKVPTMSEAARVAIVTIVAFLYGCLRSACTLPIVTPPYYAWLRTTPWRPGYPLPLGPSQLVWEDLAFTVLAMALATVECKSCVWIPVTASLIGFSLSIVSTARKAGRTARLACYGMAFSVTTMMMVASSFWWLAFFNLSFLALVMVAASEVLRQLPWITLIAEQKDKLWSVRTAHVWSMAPQQLSEPIPRLEGIVTSVLFAWITFCVAKLNANYTHFVNGIAIVGLISVSVALGRLAMYGINFGSPVSLLGRLANRIWFIPGYDSIFVAPFVIVISAFATLFIGTALRCGLPASTALAVGVTFAIALNAGPTRRQWQLTGHHRIMFLPIEHANGSLRRTARSRTFTV